MSGSRVGRRAVEDLLDRGHQVVAHARNQDKIAAGWAARGVQTVIGEITDPASVDEAVRPSEAVISALGPSMERHATGLPLVEGTRLVVEAMTGHGVSRYLGMATPSVLDVRDQRTLQTRASAFLARTFLPRAYREILGMSAAVTSSDLDWTIARFLSPRDGEATGIVRHGFFGTDTIGWAITRADIARFLVDQLDDPRYVRAAPAVSN